ncbi:MAG: zinc-ribbon domain-containing protein, partial [Rhodoferax sp.]|nr:zinc-ribbon domain-containing protein [Rhodoferax sp.]
MSLITRCPTCETMFRVVPDQLRVSEGWVRCGQCAEVFDATQNMVPSGDDAAATPPTAPRPTSNTPPPAAPAAAPAPPRPASSAPPPPPPAAPATTTPATAAPVPGAPDAAPDENRFTPSPAPADRAAAPHDDAFDVGATMRPAIDTALEDDWRDGPPTDPQTAIDTPYDADADDTDTLPPPELDFPPVPEPAR